MKFLIALLLTASVAFAAEAPRPNVVFILADDLGWEDVSFNGGQIKTPNIDSIASSGAKLAQFYVQPVCSPTRASLMTGRYPMRYGLQTGVVRPWADYGLPLEERMLPQAIKDAGYSTFIVGKWHLGLIAPEYLPTHRGFDHQYGHYNGALDYFTHVRDGGFDWHRDDKVNRDEGYSTHLLSREAAKIVRESESGKPFFLYVPFNAVHAPHQVPEKYKEPYSSMSEPRRTYAGMVAAMDEGIGEILKALDEKNLRDNTLIFFSSDNGGPAPGKVTSNGKFRAGKGTLYEGGVRVAACISWKSKIVPGTTIDQPIHMVDMYPTLIWLAGGKVEQKLPIDGIDIWPMFSLGTPTEHESILLNATPKNGAIRMGDFKLVINGSSVDADDGGEEAPTTRARDRRAARRVEQSGEEKIELFNIAKDPYEKENLAKSNPEKVKELHAAYDKFASEAVEPKSKPKAADFKSPKIWGEQG